MVMVVLQPAVRPVKLPLVKLKLLALGVPGLLAVELV